MMPVNEQLLTSYIIDLNNLGRLLVRLSDKQVNSNREDLLVLLKSLRLAETLLVEQLILEPLINPSGVRLDVI